MPTEIRHAISAPHARLPAYPGPLTLITSRTKWAGICVLEIAITALTVLLARGNPNPFLVFVSAVAVALSIYAALLALFPRIATITLDADGFTTTRLGRHTRTRWWDVSRFTLAGWLSAPIFDDHTRRGWIWRLSAATHGGNNRGLADTYGLKGRTLADLLNRWRAEALAARPWP